METELLKLLSNGGAVVILGALCAYLLLRTIPSLEKTFRDSLSEMAKQNERQNERLIKWLASKADLPDLPKD